MPNLKAHVSLSYHELQLDLIENFCLGVKNGYFGNNPPFTVLPFTELVYQGKIDDYVNTRAAYVNGGESQKGAFILAKAALMTDTDSLAKETDIVADGDVGIIELAGFDATKTGSSEPSIPGQCVVTVKRGIAGQLISTCAKVDGAKHYGCIVVEGALLPNTVELTETGKLLIGSGGGPLPTMAIDLTDQREKQFSGLIHDVTYYFYYFAVNSKGVGPLSEPVSIVCW
jgi:hypothetical protein